MPRTLKKLHQWSHHWKFHQPRQRGAHAWRGRFIRLRSILFINWGPSGDRTKGSWRKLEQKVQGRASSRGYSWWDTARDKTREIRAGRRQQTGRTTHPSQVEGNWKRLGSHSGGSRTRYDQRLISESTLAISLQDVKIIYSSPLLRCLQTAAQASSALGVEGLCVSKQLMEIMTLQCDIPAHPKVPCEDIESYEVHIKEHDSGDFPKYPETSKEAIQRWVKVRILFVSSDILMLVGGHYSSFLWNWQT